MAYNQKNLLNRIEKVQEIWKVHNLDERTNEWIYRHHIQNQFNISSKTFYNYLAVNVAKRRRELEEGTASPPSSQSSLEGDN